MTPADFMNEVVVPTLREFRNGRRSRPSAFAVWSQDDPQTYQPLQRTIRSHSVNEVTRG
jgi:hypothetical protein